MYSVLYSDAKARRAIRRAWSLKAVRIFGRFAEISEVRKKEWVVLLLAG